MRAFMLEVVGYKEYTTIEGDTFDALSLSEYNEEKLAHHIIKANPDYCDVLIFEAGITLKIPIINNLDMPDTLPPWRRGE